MVLEVGESETSWIVDLPEEYMNNNDFDFNEEVEVLWPEGRSKTKKAYVTTVIKFSGSHIRIS